MAKYDPLAEYKHTEWPVEEQWPRLPTWFGWHTMGYHFEESRWRIEPEEEVFQRLVRGVVRDIIRSEFDPLMKELQSLRELHDQVQSGKVVLVPTVPFVLPEFPEPEVQACKAKILAEHPESGILDPFEFAEKYDLDLRLVLFCFEQLRIEGKLQEVRESPR